MTDISMFAVDGPSVFQISAIIVPSSFVYDPTTGLIDYIKYAQVTCKETIVVQMTITLGTSPAMKMLYQKVIELPYIEQWGIIYLAAHYCPHFNIVISGDFLLADISTMTVSAFRFIYLYCRWINDFMLVTESPLSKGRRKRIIRRTIRIFEEHQMVLSIIIGNLEEKVGRIRIDDNLSELTLLHLDTFYKLYRNDGPAGI